MNKLLGLILVLVIVNVSLAKIGGKRVLVLSDDSDHKNKYSKFIKLLNDKGYELDFQKTDSKVQLEKYGDFLYDHLVVLSSDQDPSFTSNEILSFIDGGNNVIISAGSAISETIRDVASECGIEVEEDKMVVFDQFTKTSESPETFTTSNVIQDSPIIVKNLKTPILYKGSGQKVRDSPLNFAILSGNPTSYSGKVATGAAGKLQGKRVGLVSALQARNNARFTFIGSSDLLADSSLDQTKYSNKDFVEQVVSWTFQERGILRASELSIERNNQKVDNITYLTVKDSIKYSLKIEEFVNDKWIPYVGELELEIICLDPYIRTFIKGTKQGIYTTDITLPDVYGVFTFEGNVRVPGYGNLQSLIRHPIRPFRHDSYERFIPSAFPYYAAAFSMIIGTFVFTVVFLLHQDTPTKVKTH